MKLQARMLDAAEWQRKVSAPADRCSNARTPPMDAHMKAACGSGLVEAEAVARELIDFAHRST